MHDPAGVSPAQNSCGHLAARGLLYFLNCNQCHTNFSEGRDVLFYFRSVKQKQTIAVNLRALKRHLTEPYPVLIVWESTVLAQLAYWANSLWHNNDPWVAMRYHPTVILSPVVDILSDFKITLRLHSYPTKYSHSLFFWTFMVTVLVVLLSCITIRDVTKELNTTECTLDLYDISGRTSLTHTDQYSIGLFRSAKTLI